jgi:hypothetical protein
MLGNNAIAHRCKLGLLYACLFGGILGIGANRFEVALAVVPPLDEVAPFRMKFVLSADSDSIATNTALRIKKGAGVPPFSVNFDLFEKDYVWSFGHLGESLEEPLIGSPINILNASK